VEAAAATPNVGRWQWGKERRGPGGKRGNLFFQNIDEKGKKIKINWKNKSTKSLSSPKVPSSTSTPFLSQNFHFVFRLRHLIRLRRNRDGRNSKFSKTFGADVLALLVFRSGSSAMPNLEIQNFRAPSAPYSIALPCLQNRPKRNSKSRNSKFLAPYCIVLPCLQNTLMRNAKSRNSRFLAPYCIALSCLQNTLKRNAKSRNSKYLVPSALWYIALLCLQNRLKRNAKSRNLKFSNAFGAWLNCTSLSSKQAQAQCQTSKFRIFQRLRRLISFHFLVFKTGSSEMPKIVIVFFPL